VSLRVLGVATQDAEGEAQPAGRLLRYCIPECSQLSSFRALAVIAHALLPRIPWRALRAPAVSRGQCGIFGDECPDRWFSQCLGQLSFNLRTVDVEVGDRPPTFTTSIQEAISSSPTIRALAHLARLKPDAYRKAKLPPNIGGRAPTARCRIRDPSCINDYQSWCYCVGPLL
jgi:hypothetical protein